VHRGWFRKDEKVDVRVAEKPPWMVPEKAGNSNSLIVSLSSTTYLTPNIYHPAPRAHMFLSLHYVQAYNELKNVCTEAFVMTDWGIANLVLSRNYPRRYL